MSTVIDRYRIALISTATDRYRFALSSTATDRYHFALSSNSALPPLDTGAGGERSRTVHAYR
eukprot:2533912-Prymnesium_polylepis.1